MITYKKEQREIKTIVSIICDKCNKEFTDDMEIQEFLHIRDAGGYNSIFGDGVKIEYDICQYCLFLFLNNKKTIILKTATDCYD